MTKAQAVDLQAKSKPYDPRSPCEPLKVVLERDRRWLCDGPLSLHNLWILGPPLNTIADRAFAPTSYKLGILLVVFFWSRDNLPSIFHGKEGV